MTFGSRINVSNKRFERLAFEKFDKRMYGKEGKLTLLGNFLQIYPFHLGFSYIYFLTLHASFV